jgi:hypothetical protein
MKTILRWWERAWFECFDPLPVSLYRISLGLLITIMYAALYPNWERFYSADGMISLHDADLVRPIQDPWSVFYWADGVMDPRWFWLLGFLAALAFTAGWLTRIATIILYVLESSMIHRNLAVVNGEDLVFRMLLFYSCFAPLGFSLSIDSWLRKKRDQPNTPAGLPRIWPVRLMQVNVAMVYAFAILYRLADKAGEWIHGDAIYWAMMSSVWSRWPLPALLYGPLGMLLSRVITYSTILIELAFPFLVWFRRPRPYVLIAVTCLQIGIALLIANVAFFALSMVCVFWVYVPAETLRQGAARFRAFLEQMQTRVSPKPELRPESR